jgi:hypothetical protein
MWMIGLVGMILVVVFQVFMFRAIWKLGPKFGSSLIVLMFLWMHPMVGTNIFH